MVLAAGLGKRMRPITETIPKPLIKIAGRTLIDRCLDLLAAAGVETAVVNVHHLGHLLVAHLRDRARPTVRISDETELLLDSGGGIVKALPYFGPDPFLVLNADTFWLDQQGSGLKRLAAAWDDARMDILLLLARHEQAVGHEGPSDFLLGPDGRLSRAAGRSDGMIYAGAAIVHPRIFVNAPRGPHSLNLQFDWALKDRRLFGVPLEECWITVGTPDAIAPAEAAVAVCESG
ncbi:MAG: nucleotidyltransferase family protein [Rhizobiaceae bacterium]|nr:nucleotidyltransferase family protein [Rhizobiaceae bacterium]MCV0404706.1 nucleotidyltransferase family protein [Rhizobiaceae bacterium]